MCFLILGLFFHRGNTCFMLRCLVLMFHFGKALIYRRGTKITGTSHKPFAQIPLMLTSWILVLDLIAFWTYFSKGFLDVDAEIHLQRYHGIGCCFYHQVFSYDGWFFFIFFFCERFMFAQDWKGLGRYCKMREREKK